MYILSPSTNSYRKAKVVNQNELCRLLVLISRVRCQLIQTSASFVLNSNKLVASESSDSGSIEASYRVNHRLTVLKSSYETKPISSSFNNLEEELFKVCVN